MLYAETSIASDATHRESVDRIVARDREDALAVCQDDVLATLPRDAKSGFLERSHCLQVVDTGNLRHC